METLVNLKTWLTGGSMFTAIKTAENFPFFSDTQPAELDQMLSLTYGERMVASAFNNFDINTAGKFITKLYGGKWYALIQFNITPPDIGAKTTTKTTGKQNTIGTKNGVSNTENKVSAFNSDNLITDTGANNELEENTLQDITQDSSTSVIDWQTAFNNLSIAERTNIISVVLKDVASYLTVSVYC